MDDSYDLVVIGAGPAGEVAAGARGRLRAQGARRRAEQARWGGHDHRRRAHEGAARSRALPDRLPPGGGLRRPGGGAAGGGDADPARQGRAGARRAAGGRRTPVRRTRHRLPAGDRPPGRGPYRPRHLPGRTGARGRGARGPGGDGVTPDALPGHPLRRSGRLRLRRDLLASHRPEGHRHRRWRPDRRRVRHRVHRSGHPGDARQQFRSPAAEHRRRSWPGWWPTSSSGAESGWFWAPARRGSGASTAGSGSRSRPVPSWTRTPSWSPPAARPTPKGSASNRPACALDARGRIVVDRYYRTTAPGIYAAGDVVEPGLASNAMQQGRAAAAHACGLFFGVEIDQTASSAVYGLPEVASVGCDRRAGPGQRHSLRGGPLRPGHHRARGDRRARWAAEADLPRRQPQAARRPLLRRHRLRGGRPGPRRAPARWQGRAVPHPRAQHPHLQLRLPRRDRGRPDPADPGRWVSPPTRPPPPPTPHRRRQYEARTAASKRVLAALGNWRVWYFALIYFCLQIAVYGVTFFLPTQVTAMSASGKRACTRARSGPSCGSADCLHRALHRAARRRFHGGAAGSCTARSTSDCAQGEEAI